MLSENNPVVAKMFYLKHSQVEHNYTVPADSVIFYYRGGLIFTISLPAKVVHTRTDRKVRVVWYNPRTRQWCACNKADALTEEMLRFREKYFHDSKKKARQMKLENPAELMKADRKHKHNGNGGQIISRHPESVVTDYECRGADTLHDFRRAYVY